MTIHFNKDTLTMSQAAAPPRKPRKSKKQTVDSDETLASLESSYNDLYQDSFDEESNIEIDEPELCE